MRRDYFTLEARNVESSTEDGGAIPTVHIDFEGPGDQLLDRITDEADEPLDPDEVDVAYRIQASSEDGGAEAPRADGEAVADASGVVAVTNRVTGEFILELNADAADVLAFVRAARDYGTESDDDDRYRIELSVDGDRVATYDKTTFLVYDEEGDLLREHSLIPNNVEL